MLRLSRGKNAQEPFPERKFVITKEKKLEFKFPGGNLKYVSTRLVGT